MLRASTVASALFSWQFCYFDFALGIALGQATVLWQYAVQEPVTGSISLIDLDEGNPNIAFQSALGQYCPIPNP